MPAALLQTKLYRPAPRSNLVVRTKLLSRLDRGIEAGSRLTLVSAPPGFGKTTLVTGWLARSHHPSAWLALDSQDNDFVRFFTYLVRALQTVAPQVGENLLSALGSRPLPPLESLLSLLVNDLCTLTADMILVLDDYHVIDDAGIHAGLAFLIDHLPRAVHLVLCTRVDPPLPLSRYRSRAQLAEIRTDDLRFTTEEAAQFLNTVMGLTLSTLDVSSLEARTEGWAAGLQMAGLSIQGRRDPAEFIQSFSGSNRYILDYLLEEVLERQPIDVQDFLLHTSILDQLSGPLCDQVTGTVDGQARLEKMERDNLFLVPADDERRWYRYHQLFRDLLLARLMRTQSAEIPQLHRRASLWFEAAGLPAEAIPHALAAGDFERAALILERDVYQLMAQGLGLAASIAWTESIPRAVLDRHPALTLRYAFVRLLLGQVEGLDELISQAEQRIQDQADMPGADTRDLEALCSYVRAYHALLTDDLDTSIRYSIRALARSRPDDLLLRSFIVTQLGELYALSGQLDEAAVHLEQAIELNARLGQTHTATVSCCRLAGIAKVQGRLSRARELYDRNFRLIEELGDKPPGTVGMVEAGMADLLLERGQSQEAWELLGRAQEHTQILGKPYEQAVVCRVQVQLLVGRGELARASELLREGELLTQRHPSYRMVPAMIDRARVRYWLAAGDLAAARRWLDEREITGRTLLYTREPEHLLLARILMAEDRFDEVQELLGRLRDALQAGGRNGRLIEVLVLQSLASCKQGNSKDAVDQLKTALSLAEPEGFVRVFLDEGEPMQVLLRKVLAAPTRSRVSSFAGQLLEGPHGGASAPEPSQATALDLPEPLSPRELEVLHLVGQGLSNREIADRLIISQRTVKKHVENIYGKLGVKNRSQAILRAQELKLL